MIKKFNLHTLNKYVNETDIVCEKHPNTDLYLYGYYHDPSENSRIKWDEINIHCRGMIVNEDGDVIEHPFSKFWTFTQYISSKSVLLNDNQILKLPECSYRITEKIDGTMVTLYWINDKPYLATQRSFTNIKAQIATDILYEKYSNIFHTLKREYTYVFEAVYPETKVLIDYGSTRDLFLIGIIEKKTGKLLPLENIGFPMAKDFTQEYGHIKNFLDLANLNLPNQEGFVIQYDSGELIKIKFPWYSEAHHLFDKILHYGKQVHVAQNALKRLFKNQNGNRKITTLDIWQCLKCGDLNLNAIKANISDYYYMFGLEHWLENQKNKLLKEYQNIKNNAGIQGSEINWDIIKPCENEIVVFDINIREQQPHIYETIVWNWEKRFFKA